MQKSVDGFIARRNLSCGAQLRYIDLVSEVGELGKEILKGSEYGQIPFLNTENTEVELGDCLFSLLALCSEMGIDANQALRRAFLKYEARFAQRGDISSGR